MKEVKSNILFIDEKVASKDFACYFLNDSKVYYLNCNEENKSFSNYSFAQKRKVKFDFIFVFSKIDVSTMENIVNCLKDDGIVLTNNYQVNSLLSSYNYNIYFINIDLGNEKAEDKKITVTCNKEICLGNKDLNITFKFDEKIIEKQLSNLIISNAIQSACLINKCGYKKILWNPRIRKLIINIIDEQIKITNSALINIDNSSHLNFYKFVSGNNAFANAKKHILLFTYLSNYKEHNIETKTLIDNIESIIELNYNKYIEIKLLNKVIDILKKQLWLTNNKKNAKLCLKDKLWTKKN